MMLKDTEGIEKPRVGILCIFGGLSVLVEVVECLRTRLLFYSETKIASLPVARSHLSIITSQNRGSNSRV